MTTAWFNKMFNKFFLDLKSIVIVKYVAHQKLSQIIDLKNAVQKFAENIGLSNDKKWFTQGGASEWRVHSTLIFENLKLIGISKNSSNTI